MSEGNGAKPAFHRLSVDDHGPIIVIVAYSCMFLTLIITLVRFALAWTQRLRFQIDDGTFLLGASLATTSSIFAHLSANGGLGKRIAAVDDVGLDKFYKMMYATELSGIVAMAFAKTSVVLLSHRVAPREPRLYFFMLALIAFWTVFSTFGIAFQCGLPHPWVYVPSHCPSRANLLYPIIILNILTDVLLATWILPTLSRLLMDTGKRMTVMVLFGARLIVCCFEILQLVSVARHVREKDVTFAAFGNILWGLCVIHLSVLLATLPRTNRFIEALQTMHTSTRLTDFELANTNAQAPNVLPKHSLSMPAALTSTATTTKTAVSSKTHARPQAHSPALSNRSGEEPLFDMPLKLTPSGGQNFTTQITSHEEQRHSSARRFNAADWRQYLPRNKHDEGINLASMLWKSRTSHGHERIVQTREVTQEVEVMPPKESSWGLSKPRRASRGVQTNASNDYGNGYDDTLIEDVRTRRFSG